MKEAVQERTPAGGLQPLVPGQPVGEPNSAMAGGAGCWRSVVRVSPACPAAFCPEPGMSGESPALNCWSASFPAAEDQSSRKAC